MPEMSPIYLDEFKGLRPADLADRLQRLPVEEALAESAFGRWRFDWTDWEFGERLTQPEGAKQTSDQTPFAPHPRHAILRDKSDLEPGPSVSAGDRVRCGARSKTIRK